MPRILDALETADDFYLDELARVEVDHWSRGRVSLVGDAVHCGSPLAGHGTTLAMIGAYVLAGELAAADGDHVPAFTAYQGELSQYVTRCQQLPPGGLRAMAPRTLRGIWLRDAYGRLMTTGPMIRLIARLMTSADDITLKEYADRSVATSAESEA
jgi:2-polyprenyl-6-methoxyphenol hydroxylase-like FAD-dependent oxidoreductase